MSDEQPAVKARVDWFLCDVFDVSIDLTEQTQTQMVAHAEMFLRCNGPITWDRWSLLSEASRAAFLKASENVRGGV